MRKFIAIILTMVTIVLLLVGCGNNSEEDVITEYEILSAKYTSLVDGVFNKKLKETFTINYMDKNGECVTVDIDPSYQLTIGEENKVIYTNEGDFLGYRHCMLTQEAYNKIVSSSPMVVNVYEKDGAYDNTT